MLNGCAVFHRTAKSPNSTATSKKQSEETKVNIMYYYYNACKEKMLGNYDLAISLFSKCVSLDPTNYAAQYEIGNIYYFQNDPDKAITYAKIAAFGNPKNPWYQLLYANCLKDKKQYSDLVKVYQQLTKNFPTRKDFYYDLASSQMLANKPNEALNTYNKIESLSGIQATSSLAKVDIYENENHFTDAENELKKLINVFPTEPRYYGLLGNIYLEKNDTTNALEMYHQILKIDPQNAFAHLSLADYYKGVHQDDRSYGELKIAFANPDLDIDTKIKILLSYYTLTDTHPEYKKQAMELCKILVKADSNEAKAFSMYGDFLIRDGSKKEARDAYRKSIQLDSSKYALWNQVIILDSELGDFPALLKESQEAMDLFPNQPLPYLLIGMADIEAHKDSSALAILQQGVVYAFDNKDMTAQFYSNIGDEAFKLKQYKTCFDAFDRSLAADSTNGFVLNNYSYYLSLQGQNLAKAEEMAKRANQIDTANSSFQDTYAWIFYKAGDYANAKKWSEKAISNGGSNSTVILEHYGDILYKTGNVQGALKYWNEAKKHGNGSEFLDKKIADKKLYE
ncbi:MAG TPA: tetratricopeptide repeat protein [Bacteroidia bacterium]|nr:tetratricopeptide repeat protein [Bacteroidia bacterium]